MEEDTKELLIEDIEQAESIEELQSHVLLANQHLESDEDIQSAGLTAQSAKLDLLTEWLNVLNERMEELADEHGVTSYSVSLSGSLTGPSISISVTNSFDSG